jgi:hypothetical protein
MTWPNTVHALRFVLPLACLALAGGLAWAESNQGAAPSQTVILLANATRPKDLDFEGAICHLDASGQTMTCSFQQVLLVPERDDPATCTITTNRYEKDFLRMSETRWVSNSEPDGLCGVVTATTLQKDPESGDQSWTIESHKVVTNKDVVALCRSVDDTPKTMSWKNTRRALPCRFVRPRAILP